MASVQNGLRGSSRLFWLRHRESALPEHRSPPLAALGRGLIACAAFLLCACAGDAALPPPTLEAAPLVRYPRPSATEYEVSVHIFDDPGPPTSAARFKQALRAIKLGAFGDAQSPTTWVGANGHTAQMAVQTQFTLDRYVTNPQLQIQNLIEIIRAVNAEGFSVQLLLPVHVPPEAGSRWMNVDWDARRWKNGATFVPFQPCHEDTVKGEPCAYDVICNNLHVPVIIPARRRRPLGRVGHLRDERIRLLQHDGLLGGLERPGQRRGLAPVPQ